MILKELYLYPDLVEFNDEVVHPFRDQSRCICNYLERRLKSVKFVTNDFKRICFVGKRKPSAECFVNSSKVLIVEIPFDENQYKTIKKDKLNIYFSKMLVLGIEKCQTKYDIPGKVLIKGLSEFRENNYINKWTFKTKLLKQIGVTCTLECELTIDYFCLSLRILKGNDIILDRAILKTEPDEIVFNSKFKDVQLDGNFLVVLDRFGNAIYSLRIDELKV
jgi:hypothetical protein